jgi:hypothetical protein
MSHPRNIPLTVPIDRVNDFLALARKAGWHVEDTGDRVMTDAGPEAEAVLVLVTAPRLLVTP